MGVGAGEVGRLVFAELGAPMLAAFRKALAGTGLAAKTQVTYLERVNDFVRWWRNTEAFDDAVTSERGRDRVVGAYCEHLITGRGVEPSTVNVSLAALDALYEWLEFGPVELPRAVLAQIVPNTLDALEQSRLLAAAGQRGLRDYSVVTLALDAGPRVSEIAALNDGDLRLDAMADRGEVVLTGPRKRRRTVAIGAGCRAVMTLYRADRRTRLGGNRAGPLFITEDRRGRLAVRTVDYIIRAAGRDAGLEISPSTLRNTCEQRLLRSGMSSEAVAVFMGQDRPNPARVRALAPSGQLAFDLSA